MSDPGSYRRAVRWTNLVLLLVAIGLAITIGPFAPFSALAFATP